MATRVLSVEIGQGVTHAVEMDYEKKSNPKIYNCFSFRTPDGVLADGLVKRNNAFTNILSMELRRRRIQAQSIVYTVSSSRIASREVTIPMVKDREIQKIIDANANEYFPVDMSQYHLIYQKLGTVNQRVEQSAKGEKGKQANSKNAKNSKNAAVPGQAQMLRLNLLAVPNDVTKSYFDFSTSVRLALRGIDYMGNSVYQSTKNSFGKGTNVIIKIDTTSTLVTILEDRKVVLQRTINTGIANATEIVLEEMLNRIEYDENETEEEREEKKVDYLDAIAELTEEQFVAPTFDTAPVDDNEVVTDLVRTLREDVTNSFKHLVGNLGRVIDYYVSRHENVEINSFTAIGAGADFVGMTELLSNELGMEIKPLTKIAGVSFENGLDKKIKLGEYAACIGAGIKTQNIVPLEELQKDLKESLMFPFIIAVGCVVLSMGLYIGGSIRLSVAQNTRDNLETRKNKLQVYEDKKETRDAVVAAAGSIEKFVNSSTNQNAKLTETMALLERLMPSTFEASDITSTEESLSMNVTVESKAEAAKVLQQLRSNSAKKYFASVQSSAISEVEVANGNTVEKQVGFSVVCYYNTETEAGEADTAE